MKYIILCGDIDNHSTNNSLPKPLNLINGRHMIEYVIESIPSNEIFIIYNIFLDEYNFQELLINKCKSTKFYFSQIDYITRGDVETALVGINNFHKIIGNDNNDSNGNDNIVFIGYNNLYNLCKKVPIFENEFIGYSIDYPNYKHNNIPSFTRFENNQITSIEVNKISDFYGFKNINNFKKYALMLLENPLNNYRYFNFIELYNLIIKNNGIIEPYFIEHIGPCNYITDNQKLRICFDLDNTLVSYPTVVGDYSTVKPINKNITLLKSLKKDGHQIIIYTARRMKTHNGNVGKVIKDIAGVTIDTLERFNIEYDELIFGKPIADIYIDDRAINPYINDISYFGLFYDTDKSDKFISNKIKNNKYNKIKKCDEYIIKTGPCDILKGELYYYQNIPVKFEKFFPKLYNYNKNDNYIEIKIDYIEGIPLYYLYKSNLLTYKHIDELFDILNQFHTHKDEIIITNDNIKNNYINKLKNRFNKNDYYFDDSNEILEDIIEGIESYFTPMISPMIHGDFWFSNIILTYKNNYKFIDMKGIVDKIPTLNGDIYYDYGKLYQSILGYDLILNNNNNNDTNNEYIFSMKTYFLNKCHSKGLNISYLKYVTKGLVFGTIPFIGHYESKIKNNIWDFIKSDLMNDVSF